jgi:hypothetical protein
VASLCFVSGAGGGGTPYPKKILWTNHSSVINFATKENPHETSKLLIADGVLYGMDVVTMGNVVKERYEIAERT